MKNKNNQLLCKLICIIVLFLTIQCEYACSKTKSHMNFLTFTREVKTLSQKTKENMRKHAQMMIKMGGFFETAAGVAAVVTANPIGLGIALVSSSILAAPAGIAYAILGTAEGYNIKHKSDIKVSFQETDHCITKGQPYTGISFIHNKVDVIAGRKGSHSVAQCFTNWFKNGGVTTFDRKPSDLNFAVKGTLTVTYPLQHPMNIIDKNTGRETTVTTEKYVFNNIILAQGHKGATNNWWFGGTDCKIESPGIIECPLANLKKNNQVALCFSRADTHVSSISMLTCTPPKSK